MFYQLIRVEGKVG